MIGWWIVIAAQTPEEYDRVTNDPAATVLATWETGLGGIAWLRNLTEEGKAAQLSTGGYPNRYTAKAGDVLPLLADGPPAHAGPTVIGEDYVMPSHWIGNVIMHPGKIAACPPDQLLTIEAWDQS